MFHMNHTKNIAALVEPFPALIKAVRRIMLPMVHLLLKTGITFPQFSELLKEIYIEVADKKFQLDKKKQTQTRLSFITGIHRKDVKRLHNVAKNIEEPENVSVGVQLVSKWINQPRYLDENGKPLILPLKGINNPSFEELVGTVCKHDIRASVVLDEWLNLGVVVLINDDDNTKRVQLCTEAFIPKEGLDEKAFFVGHNISDHLSAASHNLLSDSPKFFERCAYYDDLSDESIEELESMVAELGMETLKKINNRASQLKVRDMAKSSSKQRINIGLYFYHEHEDENPK